MVNKNSDVKIIQQNLYRGGEKLHNLLIGSEININGKECLDVGASTEAYSCLA